MMTSTKNYNGSTDIFIFFSSSEIGLEFCKVKCLQHIPIKHYGKKRRRKPTQDCVKVSLDYYAISPFIRRKKMYIRISGSYYFDNLKIPFRYSWIILCQNIHSYNSFVAILWLISLVSLLIIYDCCVFIYDLCFFLYELCAFICVQWCEK